MLFKSWLSSLTRSRFLNPSFARRRNRQRKRNAAFFAVAAIESLEDRTLLSVTGVVIGTTVAFSGDAGTDTASLTVESGGYLAINGSTDLDGDASFNDLLVADVTGLTYDDTGNNDTLRFEGSNPFNFSSAPAISLGATDAVLTLIVSQDVTISGTGTFTVEAARNVLINPGASISTDDGDITLRANQAATPTSGNFTGIEVSSSDISSNDGSILLEGRGGDTSTFNFGVFLHDGAIVESTGTNKADAGIITINGTGGEGADRNHGVLVRNLGTRVSSVAGDISIDGQGGGNSTDVLNVGVWITGGSIIESTGTTKSDAATISINGMGGDGTAGNYGVIVLSSGTRVSSVAGDLSMTGQGGGNGTSNTNYGVYVLDGGAIESTGTNKADAATITIDATGGDGTESNTGMFVRNAGSRISSVAGDISVNTLGGGNGTANSNYGLFAANGGIVESTGASKADAATISIDATGGDGPSLNYGVRLDSSSRVSSVAGDIAISGQGGGNGTAVLNQGVLLIGGIIESTGTGKADAATITIDGTGGDGTSSNRGMAIDVGSKVSSVAGNISIAAHGGGNGTATSNYGFLQVGGIIESTGTTKANAATISIIAIGGHGTSANHGTNIGGGAKVSSVAGDISITATGGGNSTADSNMGFAQTGGVIESTGTTKADAATITINGTGGDGTDQNHGVLVRGSGATVRSAAGNISVTGQGGGNGTDAFNVGVYVDSGGLITSTGSAKTDAATITIDGTGGDGTLANHGVLIQRLGARVSSVAGDISVTAQGGGNGTANSNAGLVQTLGGIIESTGTSKADAAAIMINGTGGNGTTENHGVYVVTSGSRVSSVAGDISINGQGGGNGTDGFNVGSYFDQGGVVESTDTSKANAATITLDGTGGTGTTANHGVLVQRAGSRVSSEAGDISISGQGGGGSGNGNRGVFVLSGGIIESTGTSKVDAAMITIDGTGGSGTSENDGVYIVTSGSRVSSMAGDILIVAQGGGTGTDGFNLGLYVDQGGVVESTGVTKADAATITLVGTGGTGTASNHGVLIRRPGSQVSSVAGDISIDGQGGSGSGGSHNGIYILTDASVDSSGGGDIDLIGTAGSGSSRGLLVQSASTVSTAGGDINVTGTGSGGAPSIEATGIDAGSGAVTLSAISGIITAAEAGTDVTGSSVTINGEVAPAGTSATGLVVIDGDVAFSSGDSYTIELNGLTAGSGFDQMQVVAATHTTSLGGASLNVSLGFSPAVGNKFVLINNIDATSSVSGTFDGLAEGAVLSVGSTSFHITYQGGTDNNDVVLTVFDNSPPTVDNQSFDVEENSSNGTSVGTIAASDPDLPGDTLAFSLIGGTGATAFAVDAGSGEITVADSAQLDFEATISFTLQVKVTDASGAIDTANVTINLLNVTATISGTVFVDVDGDDLFDGGTETTIDGVTVELLTGAGGFLATDDTEFGGFYAFTVDDEFATYRIHEIQPTGVSDGAAILGDANGNAVTGDPADGTVISSNQMQLTLTGINANDYDFTEVGEAVQPGDTASLGFWQNKNGQALIEEGGTELADWLTDNFANIFGDTFVGGDGSDVASFYKNEFLKKKLKGTPKVDAQFMSLALATYFTSSNLSGGTVAAAYGFTVTDTGMGTKVVNVGDNGAAFGVADNTDLTIMALLLATNDFTGADNGSNDGVTDTDDNSYSNVYDTNGDGLLDAADKALRAMANEVYTSINEEGAI